MLELWRAVLEANHVVGRNDRTSTNHYVRLCGPMKLQEYQLRLADFPSYGEIVPFESWSAAQPTQSISWYDSYNSTKHNRGDSFDQSTLENAIFAVAAARVMLYAVFGPDLSPTADPFVFVPAGTPVWTDEECYNMPEDYVWTAVDYAF